jgi:hypothetical protein
MLYFLSEFIKKKLEKEKIDKEFLCPKAFLYQMYFVIAKLDENRLANLDFMVNFGVSQECIRLI